MFSVIFRPELKDKIVTVLQMDNEESVVPKEFPQASIQQYYCDTRSQVSSPFF